jgi:hypothetical protein
MNMRRRPEQGQSKEKIALPSERDILLAILALLVDEREIRAAERPKQTKTELLLADAGLPLSTIATLLNKQTDAIRMSVTRARDKDLKAANPRNVSKTVKPTSSARSNA